MRRALPLLLRPSSRRGVTTLQLPY